MSLSFVILCGKCFRVVPANSSGSVLSCGDILCSTCNNIPFGSSSTCPACGKDGVKTLNLNEKLPEEVSRNLSDPSKELESIHEVLVFQVKYYKQIMKRLLLRANKSEHECENYRRIIMELENKLQNANTVASHQPTFSGESSNTMSGGQVVWNSGSSSRRQGQVLIEDPNSQYGHHRPSSSASVQGAGSSLMTSPLMGPMRTPYGGMTSSSSSVPIVSSPMTSGGHSGTEYVPNSGGGGGNGETVLSVLGKRPGDEYSAAKSSGGYPQQQNQQQQQLQQQHQQQQSSQYMTHSSPRLGAMGSPLQHQQHAQSHPHTQASPQHRQFVTPNANRSGLHSSGGEMGIASGGRQIGTPSGRLPPPCSGNRPISSMGRKIQSPVGMGGGGGGPMGTRLRSPHVPLVRSPLHISPNRGVSISQSEHQLAHRTQMQQYANQQQQQQQQQGKGVNQDSGPSLSQFIGEG